MKEMKLLKHFDFQSDTYLDKDYWNVQVGEKWANNELQQYVDSEDNLFFRNGLVIKATFENNIYRSSRINTRNKLSFKYGRVDIEAKVPKGIGTWPALWMMSEEQKYGSWPRSGEIDIMEHVGRDENNLFLCLHTESYNHKNAEQYYTEFYLEGACDDFHMYSIIWEEESITYLVDDNEICKYNKFDKEDNTFRGWPFDQNFFLIMNLAIGGKFGGPVDDSIFPVEFIIKDIKIYK